MKQIQILYRGALVAVAAWSALALPLTGYAQSVVVKVNSSQALDVNGNNICASAPVLGMDPSGNLTITCTPAASSGGGTPTAVPSCTVNSPSVTAGSNATVAATCSNVNSSTTYAWTNVNAAPGYVAPAANASSFTMTFSTAGNYGFSVIATNNIGPSAPAAGTVVVTAASSGGGGGTPSGCSAVSNNNIGPAVTDTYAQVNMSLPRGASMSYALPLWAANTAQHAYYIFQSAQNTASQSNLGTQFAISTCPGDFTSMPAACRVWGVADTGGTQLQGNSGAGAAQYCWMAPGTQYYLNVRNVLSDGVTPSCNAGTCYWLWQMHTGYY